MKSTGIVRRIDDLGRVVLPVELRRTLDLEVRDPVEIFIEGDAIVLRKSLTLRACSAARRANFSPTGESRSAGAVFAGFGRKQTNK